MDENQIRQIVKEEIAAAANSTLFNVSDVPFHLHNGIDSPKLPANNINFSPPNAITFNGETTNYRIYRQAGDNGDLIIEAYNSGGNGTIDIGNGATLSVNIIGVDEGLLGADDGIGDASYLLMEPDRGGFSTTTTDTFRLGMPNLGSDPVAGAVGDLTVVGGKLKICTNAVGPVWTIVGTQS